MVNSELTEVILTIRREAIKELAPLAAWSREAQVGSRVAQAINAYKQGWIRAKDGHILLTESGKKARKEGKL